MLVEGDYGGTRWKRVMQGHSWNVSRLAFADKKEGYKMLTRIKTKEAARQLSISEQAVKVQMQRGLLPIGTIMNNGGTRNTYVIYQEWLDEWAKNRPKEVMQR